MKKIYFLGKTNAIPVAWLLLARFPRKLVISLAGIIFATVLIHAQLGIRASLFDSSIAIFKSLNADVIMLHKSVVGSPSFVPIKNSRLGLLFRYDEVIDAMPLRYGFVNWRYPGLTDKRLAIMIGFNPSDSVFIDEDIIHQQDSLILPDRVLYDSLSRREFGDVKRDFNSNIPTYAFANNHRVLVSGLLKIGTSFSYDASFITSLSTYNSIESSSETEFEIGLIRLSPNVNPAQFVRLVGSAMPSDVQLYTLNDFLALETSYWDNSKPIGFVFAFNTILGFIVGMLILYQLLYTDVSDHLSEFSTMLAIAHTSWSLRLIVLKQSFYLTSFGYPIGFLVTLVLFRIVSSITGLPVKMSLDRALLCLGIILLMSSCSAVLAMQKLDDANPIELFE